MYRAHLDTRPKRQLERPVCAFVEALGAAFSRPVEARSQAQVERPGRPDIEVIAEGTLVGQVELRAPGAGARPQQLTGDAGKPWGELVAVPNLLLTDGIEWGLYRGGELVEGTLLRAFGDPTVQGADAFTPKDVERIAEIVRSFLHPEPVAPPPDVP